MVNSSIISWLLNSDVSIQYQVHRDLLGKEINSLQKRIETEGWGANFLARRSPNSYWGLGFYQPKWTSTHYTLLDLKNLQFPRNNSDISNTIIRIIDKEKNSDGGINPSGSVSKSDVCINGMFLNYASYFGAKEKSLESVVDFILSQQMTDGGFNCQLNRKGAVHSSLHSTLSVIEGINEYVAHNYNYRHSDLKTAEKESIEFILQHKLYQSHRTGKMINRKMIMLSHPARWRYNILRALDYFKSAGIPYDSRMDDALNILKSKQRLDQKWPVQEKHAGLTHFEMEKTGKASRWNTLIALRVFKHFNMLDRLGTTILKICA